MNITAYKETIYGQLGRLGKAISSPRRLELLELLCQAPRTVEALATEARQSVANTSQHLQVLRSARLVETERDGQFITYRPASGEVAEFLRSFRGLAESLLAEMEKVRSEYLNDRVAMEPVHGEDLVERARRGEVTGIDVRPKEEYRAGHLPGAVSVPLAELKRRIASLPKDKDVVAYCRGPYCVLAVEAVEILRKNGFNAQRMDDGVAELRAKGLTISEGEQPQ